MAYDEELAGRARAVPPRGEAVTERRMSGGLAFMLGGHMTCGAVTDTLSGSRVPAATGRLHGGPGLPFPRPSPGPALWTVWYSPRLAWVHAG